MWLREQASPEISQLRHCWRFSALLCVCWARLSRSLRCTGGDLCAAIAGDDAGELRWYKRGHQIALDIARGLYFLHSHDVMHLDIKTRNILLTANQTAKVSAELGRAQHMVSLKPVSELNALVTSSRTSSCTSSCTQQSFKVDALRCADCRRRAGAACWCHHRKVRVARLDVSAPLISEPDVLLTLLGWTTALLHQ